MKEITAVIQPVRLGPVKEALSRAGITGMTVTDVRGFGSQGGSTDTYRGVEYRVEYVTKVMLTVVVEDTQVDEITDAIVEAARTGNVGDGKIWIKPVESVTRIRTGEKDAEALK